MNLSFFEIFNLKAKKLNLYFRSLYTDEILTPLGLPYFGQVHQESILNDRSPISILLKSIFNCFIREKLKKKNHKCSSLYFPRNIKSSIERVENPYLPKTPKTLQSRKSTVTSKIFRPLCFSSRNKKKERQQTKEELPVVPLPRYRQIFSFFDFFFLFSFSSSVAGWRQCCSCLPRVCAEIEVVLIRRLTWRLLHWRLVRDSPGAQSTTSSPGTSPWYLKIFSWITRTASCQRTERVR